MYNHKLIVPLKVGETKIIYYVKNEELYDKNYYLIWYLFDYISFKTCQHSLNNYCACQ